MTTMIMRATTVTTMSKISTTLSFVTTLLVVVLSLSLSLCCPSIEACTNVLVTPGASADGTAMIAYNADSENLFGMLYHYPPSHHNNENGDQQRQIYEWDTGVRPMNGTIQC